MVQSPVDFHYWHEGDGTAIVSVAMMAVAYVVASAAASRSKSSRTPFVGPNGRSPEATKGIGPA